MGCMNAIERHQNRREKRNSSKHSGFWRASYQHQTLASTPAPVSALSIHMHLLAWTYSMSSTQRILSTQSGFKQPWLPLNITLLPWQRSASPLLGKPKGFLRCIRDHSSKLRSSDPHLGGTRSRVDARGRPKARSDLPVVIRVFFPSKLCAQTHVQVIPRGSQWVVNDPLPFL